MTAIRDFLCPAWIILLAFLDIWPCVATPTHDSGTHFVLSETLESQLAVNYYDEFEDPLPGSQPTPTNGVDLRPCDYDVCLEEKAPCLELAALTRCLCPGITLEAVTPEAPSLTALTPEGSRGVVVRWCAPYSLVHTYGIRVAKRETVTVGSSRRSGTLEGLNHGDKVCVFAENASGEGPESCMTYMTDKTEGSRVSLRAVLIGGVLGLVLLTAIAVLLWKYTQRRRSGNQNLHTDSQRAYPDSDRLTLDVL